MPQLDKFSFFTQIFWLIILISIFYYLLINYFLPNLISVLKIRYKFLLKLKQELINYSNIELKLYKFKKDNIINILLILINSLIHYNTMVSNYNLRIFTKIKNYVKVLPKMSLKQKKEIYDLFNRLFSFTSK